MKLERMWTSILIAGLLLLSGCADSDFLDKNQIASSIIKGKDVVQGSLISKRVVLITKQLVVKNKIPTFFGICTGTILTRRAILTAAHCVDDDTSQMRIVIGTNPRQGIRSKKDVYKIKDKVLHPKYLTAEQLQKESLRDIKANPDLAIIYLDRPIESEVILEGAFFMTSAAPPLDDAGHARLLVTGYGKTTALRDTSKIPFNELNGLLKFFILRINPKKIIDRQFFTVSQKEDPGVCHGDSGGPAFVKHGEQYSLYAMAVGVYRINTFVTDWEKANQYNDCAGYGIYLNLTGFKPWISDSLVYLRQEHGD